MVPERHSFWELYPDTFGWSRWFVYFVSIVAVAIFVRGVWLRVQMWRAGKPAEGRLSNWKERVRALFTYGFAQIKIMRDSYSGLFHWVIFWGFVVLFIGTALTVLDEDFYRLITGEKFIEGPFYVFFSLALDVFGMLAMIGIGMAAYRRYVENAKRLDNKQEDWVLLALVFAILFGGFMSEAVRIAAMGMPTFERYASPFGYILATPFAGMGEGAIMTWHALFWFSHLFLAMAFIAFLPYTKGLHILTGWANTYTMNLGPKGKLPSIPDMMGRMEAGEDVEMGYKAIEDLTWKDRLMLDACTRCGRCQDACPAYNTGKHLNPKEVIQNLREFMLYKWNLKTADGNGETEENGRTMLEPESDAEHCAIKSEVLWDCTNCMACMNACPVQIEHIPLIEQMRRELAMEFDDMSKECRGFFKNMDVNANPWGMNPAERANWTEGLEVPTVFDNPDFEYLFWVGCLGAYDQRSQKIARSIVQILNAGGVNFAILGEMEMCCGDPLRRLGNEASFQAIVAMTKEMLQDGEINVKKVITMCPHCFNTLAHEYKDFGLDWDVVHHTVLIDELIKTGKIKLKKGEPVTAVLHDSCFLGRYNDIFEAPRNVAAAAGCNLAYLNESGDNGFCCGGGGGRTWLEEEVEDVNDKINVTRVTQLAGTGAKTFLSACPYCMMMFDEGVKLKKIKKNDRIWNTYGVSNSVELSKEDTVDLFELVECKDIAEIAAERLDV